jgi:hypothetical protein
MSEIYVSSPESEVLVEPPVVEPIEPPVAELDNSVSEWQAEAAAEAPVGTPPIPVSPPPPPSSESDEDSGTESDTEESEPTGVRRRLNIGPDDDRLYIRRQVAVGESPAVYAVAGLPVDSDLDLGPDQEQDDYVVPNEGTLIVDALAADGLLGARVPVPVWVILTALIVMIVYLCLLIGSGILVVGGGASR